MFRNISLHDYSKDLKEKPSDTGPYVQLDDGKRKITVKKTSWCWLLQRDQIKLSSFRLQKVKTPVEFLKTTGQRSKIIVNYPYKKKLYSKQKFR